MGLLIELKVEGGNGEKLAKKIIDVIEKNNYQKQAIYMSLDLEAAVSPSVTSNSLHHGLPIKLRRSSAKKRKALKTSNCQAG